MKACAFRTVSRRLCGARAGCTVPCSSRTLEARPVYRDETLIDMSPDSRNRAKDLIEDFMIAANGVSARFLEKKGLPSLRRVLKTPEHWDRIVQLASGFGYKLPDEADAVALDAFLRARSA